MTDPRTGEATALLDRFARETGLEGPEPADRYLWTDAFAVATSLGLHRRTGEERHRERALRLMDDVHRVLGRHRTDDPRRGWISGLPEEEARRHPTAGGLRIGKELPERPADEPLDPRLEWERDGQYLHYLTRWMHALLRVRQETGRLEPLCWALELARATHRGFTERIRPGGPLRMWWKASVDLSRPLVESAGAHDPLDALLTYRTLQTAAEEVEVGEAPNGAADQEAEGGLPDLGREIDEAEELCRGREWATDDPLGIGGLLLDLHRAVRLGTIGSASPDRLADDALRSLEAYARTSPLGRPAAARLPFRELGLTLGLRAVEDLLDGVAPGLPGRLERLAEHLGLGRALEDFWREPENRTGSTWTSHAGINGVMLAATLVPEGWLGPSPD